MVYRQTHQKHTGLGCALNGMLGQRSWLEPDFLSSSIKSYIYYSAFPLHYFFFNFGPILTKFVTIDLLYFFLIISARTPESLCDSTIKALVSYNIQYCKVAHGRYIGRSLGNSDYSNVRF